MSRKFLSLFPKCILLGFKDRPQIQPLRLRGQAAYTMLRRSNPISVNGWISDVRWNGGCTRTVPAASTNPTLTNSVVMSSFLAKEAAGGNRDCEGGCRAHLQPQLRCRLQLRREVLRHTPEQPGEEAWAVDRFGDKQSTGAGVGSISRKSTSVRVGCEG